MSVAYDSLGDFYRRGPLAPFVDAIREPAGAYLTLTKVGQPAGASPDPAVPELNLILMQRSSARGVLDVGTGRIPSRARSGTMVLAPPNTDCHYEQDTFQQMLVVSIPEREVSMRLRALKPSFFCDFGILHGPLFVDPLLSNLAERIWDEAAADNPRGRLFLDGTLLALLTTLLAKSENLSAVELAPAPSRGGLPPYRIRRVEELAMAHLADDLSLDALADAAGLSPFHFARAFRTETGASPHAWLLGRRIERAKELLIGTAMTVDEIAKAVGFAGKQGLIGAFKRAVGATPQAWRNARLS